MDLFSLSFSIIVLCIIFVLSLRYLSLLRWFSGQAYVLSKRQESFNIIEVLELFKNAKPFPVSYQKGWKIHSFVHGHRVWFHFLTFSRASHVSQSATTASSSASSAPCIKVYATFDRIRASAQSLLQLVKDSSLSCEWKPGVIAARSVHEVPASEVNGRNKGMTSLPVLNDFVRIERVQPSKYLWPWQKNNSANIVTHTVIEDYKRYWHREDNGCSWLLQMNEEAQSIVFFLIQPVEDPDHSLLTVVTWSAPQSRPVIPADEAPSVLLSSLSEYIHLRRVHMTPLLHISLPHHLSNNNNSTSSTVRTAEKPSAAAAASQPSLMSRFRQFVDKRSSSSRDASLKADALDTIRRSSSILHYRSPGGLLARSGLASEQPQVIQEEENESDTENGVEQAGGDSDAAQRGDHHPAQAATGKVDGEGDPGGEGKRVGLRRAFSESAARHSPSAQSNVYLSLASEKQIASYRTMINHAAADIMAEALRASNIDLETSPSVQAEMSNGWTYNSFENNIVILKKVPPPGSTLQSYIGKGFILAPPKTVWDAIRNPRTRFTYDETLKKVDILDQVAPGIKIVYLYQEMQQLLRKESCDVCCLQGERVEGSKFVLAYTSVDHPKVPPVEGVLRGQMVSSGWIIEPVYKDKKLLSLVTYLMQVDYGSSRLPSSERLPFEDMMSRHPMSISYLQQYLKPAVQLARRKSDSVIPL